jgi:hypothetical protein
MNFHTVTPCKICLLFFLSPFERDEEEKEKLEHNKIILKNNI